MKFKTITKEQAELMPFDDIAYAIIKEKGKKMKILDLFKGVCDILELDPIEYEERIADFFTLLSTEKRFIQVGKGFWDLRENYSTKTNFEEEEELSDENVDEYEEEVTEEDDSYDEILDSEDEEVEDEFEDLALLDEEELEESNL